MRLRSTLACTAALVLGIGSACSTRRAAAPKKPTEPTPPEAADPAPVGEPAASVPVILEPHVDYCPPCGRAFVSPESRKFVELYAEEAEVGCQAEPQPESDGQEP